MRVGGDAVAQVGAPLLDQNERHLEALHVRAGGPVQQGDGHAGGGEAQAPGLAGREQVRRVIDDDAGAEPLLGRGHDVLAHEQVEQAEHDGGVVLDGGEVADATGRERDHVAQSLLAAAGEHAQAAAQVVVQHEVPAAEQLLREELGDRAVGRGLGRVDVGERHEVVRVAVQHEDRRRSGEVEVGHGERPGRIPAGQFVAARPALREWRLDRRGRGHRDGINAHAASR